MAGLTEYRFFAVYAACIVEQPTIAMKIVHCIIVVCFFVLVPLGVALVSYYKVFGKTKHHNLNMASTAHAEGRENRLTVKEIKLTKSLAIVVFAFALCWIPFWIIVMIQRFASDVVPRNIQLLCPFLMFFSSTINPFIYAGMNPSFRAEEQKAVGCYVERQHQKRQRCIITMIHNGIQHSAKANTTMASDLVSLISLTVNRFSLPSAWAVEAMFRL